MINRCRKCNKVLVEGDTVKVQVKSEYHSIPSKVAFSISKNIEAAYADTLEHDDCLEEEVEA